MFMMNPVEKDSPPYRPQKRSALEPDRLRRKRSALPPKAVNQSLFIDLDFDSHIRLSKPDVIKV